MDHAALSALAAKNLSSIIRDAICLGPTEQAYIIFDTEHELTRIMLDGYRAALPNGNFIDIAITTGEKVLELFNSCTSGDLVVLLQSTNFRLNDFRVRIELFQRGLKTIEHMHLYRMAPDQFETYVNTLAYDPNYYRPLGHGLKKKIEAAKEIVVTCHGGTTLSYSTPMEEVKLNVGDYREMKNVGGTFPIGEVFTEASDLTKVNGSAMVFSYANEEHIVQIVEPFPVHIENGILTAPEAPEEFKRILDLIREDEEVLVREFGLGLNPAIGKHAMLNDITAFERQKGMHLSLGAKHAVYAKPGLNRKKGRYHIDIFIDIERIIANSGVIFENDEFVV